MKINPIGINAYQQMTGQEVARKQIDGDTSDSAPVDKEKVAIPPQADAHSSRLAVKISRGNYAEYLSDEERQALEMLFSRFSDRSRFGPGYVRDIAPTEDDAYLGNKVDVKV